ncbi:hypothetical protein H6G89_18620 [Oscillatoria sp. FACHB-1407]|uniref:hypothetical protein n=1 Tax=Oscillatoria sp. FACHB-1407 TaxID=2692847 RepID=UPI001688A931|nr:hypothetical protein [Oscillatoria sp. FACHB-1407]MBD2463055.1 hypothetical protein [Oscillatoria sp. FACHB-1407]
MTKVACGVAKVLATADQNHYTASILSESGIESLFIMFKVKLAEIIGKATIEIVALTI